MSCAFSLALSGSNAAVGCFPHQNVNVYAYESSTWRHGQTLTSSNNTATNFGDSVTMYGNYLAVGSNVTVEIFKLNENNTWVSHTNINIPCALSKGEEGHKMSMYGDRLAFVSIASDLNITSVYIYKRNGDTWDREGEVNLNSSYVSVSLYHKTMIIGSKDSPDNGVNSGSAQLYILVNNTWMFDKKLSASDVEAGDNFGKTVAIWDNHIVVGAPFDDDEGTDSGAVYLYQISKNYTVDCYGDYFEAIWLKSTISGRGDEIHISLLNQSCNAYSSNSTHIWITTSFAECGTIVTETNTSFVVSNTVIMKITKYLRQKVIKREIYHQYFVNCILQRVIEISSPHSYNVSDAVIFSNFSESSTINYELSMNFYQNESFTYMATNPLIVTWNQPIFVGIKSSNQHFKFIVTKCFATPSFSITDPTNDTFFDNKCRVDETFEVVSNDNGVFNFKIKSFLFMNEMSSVYFHCNLFICKINSYSPSCTQSCDNNRKRRDVTLNDTPLKEVVVTSTKIVFQETLTCTEITCPSNSMCIDINPDICYCNDGYVLSRRANTCTEQRTVEINDLHLEMKWNPSYADTSSTAFRELAVETEMLLYNLFKAEGTDRLIEGVKVIAARKGSVILDVKIIHVKSTTSRIAYNTFLETIMTNSSTSISLQKNLNIIKHWVPTYVSGVEKEINTKGKFLLAITLIVPLVVVFISGIILYKFKQIKRRSMKENEKGYDNNGMEQN